MMNPFGHTRSSIQRNHALITSDTHVTSPLVGWKNATAVVHISPTMGARFMQYTAILGSHATSGVPGQGIERFIYVAEGQLSLTLDKEHALSVGDFAYIPNEIPHEFRTAQGKGAKLIVFEKRYQLWTGSSPAAPIIGRLKDVPGEPYEGDPAATLQTLLPVKPEFDMAVNVFTYQPGARLPQVEVHIMEHGLQMLDGEGVYRLGDSWYPVQAGDVIWMAAYCPQWFVAMGKTPARYIYYKDINRHLLTD
jgi:(S)-ureidoglycine aminohydrolase